MLFSFVSEIVALQRMFIQIKIQCIRWCFCRSVSVALYLFAMRVLPIFFFFIDFEIFGVQFTKRKFGIILTVAIKSIYHFFRSLFIIWIEIDIYILADSIHSLNRYLKPPKKYSLQLRMVMTSMWIQFSMHLWKYTTIFFPFSSFQMV